jgi:hypothetical protein
MILDPLAARLLLVLHTALAVAAVGAGTHALIWLRRFIAQSQRANQIPPQRAAAVVRFIRLAFVLHAITFAVGNLMYPTYKVNVRVAYLDNPIAVAADYAVRVEHAGAAAPDQSLVMAAQRIARWFDVKEHVLVFGLIAWVAIWWMSRQWRQSLPTRIESTISLWLCSFATATLWSAAIIGVLTAAWRAI